MKEQVIEVHAGHLTGREEGLGRKQGKSFFLRRTSANYDIHRLTGTVDIDRRRKLQNSGHRSRTSPKFISHNPNNKLTRSSGTDRRELRGRRETSWFASGMLAVGSSRYSDEGSLNGEDERDMGFDGDFSRFSVWLISVSQVFRHDQARTRRCLNNFLFASTSTNASSSHMVAAGLTRSHQTINRLKNAILSGALSTSTRLPTSSDCDLVPLRESLYFRPSFQDRKQP